MDDNLGLPESHVRIGRTSPFTEEDGSQMNKNLQTRPLIDSKWTDLAPVQRDKHFVVTRVKVRETETLAADSIELRALISKRTRIITRDQLSDKTRWLPDWH